MWRAIMKKILCQFIILIGCGAFILCANPAIGTAEVLFSDDFNTTTWPTDYLLDSDDYSPPGSWSLANGGSSANIDGTLHYAGEVTSPGRDGADDRALKVWRNGTFYENFDGLLEYSKATIHTTRELYTRWYMKIPSDFTLSEGSCNMNYLKMWRYLYDVNVGGDNLRPIYLNFNGASFTTANMALYGIGDRWRTLIPVSEIRDGQWHCHELRIKLNSSGNSDGEVQYWIDGVEKMHVTAASFGAADNEYFSQCQLGLGNTGARDCSPPGEFQSTWRAIEFDDFVLSTTYVGPEGNSSSTIPDTQTPTVPASLQPGTLSSTQVNLEWLDSTDNIGVTGYNIYRDGAFIGSSSLTTYSDMSVVPNTNYNYSVSAFDEAGNESGLSISIQISTPQIESTSPEPYKLILSETWENNNISNWDDDLIVGDTHIDTDPVYKGNYAIKMESSNPGNYAHFFGDHPGIDGDMVTDVTLEEYYYPSPGFQWPEGLKLWIMNCFEGWGAGYNLAEGQSKPHSWAPYYMTTWVNNQGELAGQLVRADGLGGTGALWQNYYQNVGSPVSLTPGTWNKIKIRLKLNTPGSSDGIYQIWVDDELKCNYSNVNYRGTYTNYGWNHLMMSMHAFPSSPQGQWISRDDIQIHSGPPLLPPVAPGIEQ